MQFNSHMYSFSIRFSPFWCLNLLLLLFSMLPIFCVLILSLCARFFFSLSITFLQRIVCNFHWNRFFCCCFIRYRYTALTLVLSLIDITWRFAYATLWKLILTQMNVNNLGNHFKWVLFLSCSLLITWQEKRQWKISISKYCVTIFLSCSFSISIALNFIPSNKLEKK